MRYLILRILFINIHINYAQTRTVGLKQYQRDNESMYYLFTPLNSKKTFLIDECGEMINTWTSQYTSGTSQTLLDNGDLLRCGVYPPPHFGLGLGGIIERFDWNGNLKWKFIMADSLFTLHHDIEVMPNGNILAIVWEYKSTQDALDNGRKPGIASPSVWSDRIIEIKPYNNDSFEIVWEWSAWDHIIQNYDNTKAHYGDPSQHPELLDINFTGANFQDWLHINSVNYNPALDQIVLSIHSTSEIIIIDHSTNSVTASGHTGGKFGKGGDILYRWGNPQAYGRGTAQNQQFFKQHNAHWIPAGFPNAGKIMVFNNGWDRVGTKYSTIDILDPPVSAPGVYTLQSGSSFGPAQAQTAYKAEPVTNFYALNLSSAFSLKDGLFINSGPQGRFFKTNDSGEVVWEYVNPVNGSGPITQGVAPFGNSVFRCQPYPEDFIGFEEKDMSPKGPLEADPIAPSLCVLAQVPEFEKESATFHFYPNPASDQIQISLPGIESLTITSLSGKILKKEKNSGSMDIRELPAGTYLITARNSASTVTEIFSKTE